MQAKTLSIAILIVAGLGWAAPGGARAEVTAVPNQAQGKSSAAASAAASEVCALLTKQDAAAALGEGVSGPQSSSGRSAMPGTAVSSCEYTGSGLHKVQLSLWRLSPETAGQFQTVYRAECAKKGHEGLSGLGDVACWYSEKHEELQVLKGATFFSIELRKSGDPTEAIKGVAKKVFDQLR